MGPVSRNYTQILLNAMPFLIMAAVSAAAIVSGGAVSVLSLLSLGPAFAAVAGGLRYTLITGGVAVMLCAVLVAYQSLAAERQDYLPFGTVAGVTLAGVIVSAGRQRRERELADVKAIAEATQQVLLRPVPQRLGGISLAVRYMSAASGARIGGDLYEVVGTGAGPRLIIGDVQGKGLPAVQTAATVLGAFREAAHDAASLEVIADRIEASLARQGAREQFVTAILAQLSEDGSQLELLNCGHPAPLLAGPAGARFIEPADPGLPLGLSDLAVLARKTEKTSFGAGDSVLFYTDGITEARDRHGGFFTLHGTQAAAGPDPDAALERLSRDVVRHVGHALDDDAAVLLLRRDAAGQPAQPGRDGGPPAAGVPRYAPGKTGAGTGQQAREDAGADSRWPYPAAPR